MKKILFNINTLTVGGVERLTIDIVNNLKLRDSEIILIVNSSEIIDKKFKEQIDKNIKIIFLESKKEIEFIKKIKNGNFFYKMLYRIIRLYYKNNKLRRINSYIKNNPECEIYIDYSGSALKFIENIKIKRKIVWQHGVDYEKEPARLSKIENRLDGYNEIIVTCKEMEEKYKRLFPRLKNKIKMIYNFVDEERIKIKSNEKDSLSEKDKQLIKENYCVAVMRLDGIQKDPKTIINAFEILKNKGIKEKMYIIGDGEQRKELEKIIIEKKLQKEVLLLGTKVNPYIWIKNADIFIHSSFFEGFGLVLVDAGILNKLVISSRYSVGATEILEDGKSGILFEIGDSKGLAEKIEKILKQPELKENYISNMTLRIEEFKKEKVLMKYKDLIEKNYS